MAARFAYEISLESRRYSVFKGPLAVAALFLKNNRPIAALVTVICLALLIFCLAERQLRATGKLILGALATMKIIPGTARDSPGHPPATPLRLRLIDLLGIEPRQLR
jgi:hypothetical protein